jgi:hypothetical protein
VLRKETAHIILSGVERNVADIELLVHYITSLNNETPALLKGLWGPLASKSCTVKYSLFYSLLYRRPDVHAFIPAKSIINSRFSVIKKKAGRLESPAGLTRLMLLN